MFKMTELSIQLLVLLFALPLIVTIGVQSNVLDFGIARDEAYKTAQVAFVSNHNGTTLGYI